MNTVACQLFPDSIFLTDFQQLFLGNLLIFRNQQLLGFFPISFHHLNILNLIARQKGIGSWYENWFDVLSSWVEKLHGYSFVHYLGLAVFILGFQSIIAWIEGAIPLERFLPTHLMLAGAIPFILRIIPFFNQRVARALDVYSSISILDEKQHHDLKRGLKTMPAWGSFIATSLVMGFALLVEIFGSGPYQAQALDG